MAVFPGTKSTGRTKASPLVSAPSAERRQRKFGMKSKPAKFKVILADPPWGYDDPCLHRGGALRHYQTMSAEQIAKIPVQNIAAKDSTLFIWATFPKLKEAFLVLESWGFTYKTCAFVWVKTNRRMDTEQYCFLPEEVFDSFWGMGRWTRSNCELCLLGVKGKPKRRSGGVHQVVYAPIDRHSEKPAEVHDRIVKLMGNVSRVELFARKRTIGWEAFGNEVSGSIKL